MDEPGEDTCPTCGHPDHEDAEEGCEVRLAVYLGADGWDEEGRPCGCRFARTLTGAVTPDPWMDPDAAARLGPPPF
jgi:hypothetical protein